MIRIVIVEDNKTIRDGLALLINATDGLKCVSTYKDCESMLLELKQDIPDLILMDLPKDSPLIGPIQTIRESGKKAAAIVQDLLTLARRGVSISEVVHLNDIIYEYLE